MQTDEQARLAALRRYRILDTEPEQRFDDLTLLASHICGTPIALITLIDADRQWFKSRVGVTIQETARNVAFCNDAIRRPELYVVPDATRDERYRTNPFVMGEPNIRFYAGAPLLTPDGYALGTICVIDRRPRTLTSDQSAALEALRRQAEAQLELRENLSELTQALRARDHAEGEQLRLIGELRSSLDQVNRLSALIPMCSACTFEMIIPADPNEIGKVLAGVRQVLLGKEWPEDDVNAVELALSEALSNAIRHGCGNDRTKNLHCSLSSEESGELLIVVRDPGKGFERAAVADPLRPENTFKGSGRGIYLINQVMDELRFAEDGRELQMRKRRS